MFRKLRSTIIVVVFHLIQYLVYTTLFNITPLYFTIASFAPRNKADVALAQPPITIMCDAVVYFGSGAICTYASLVPLTSKSTLPLCIGKY